MYWDSRTPVNHANRDNVFVYIDKNNINTFFDKESKTLPRIFDEFNRGTEVAKGSRMQLQTSANQNRSPYQRNCTEPYKVLEILYMSIQESQTLVRKFLVMLGILYLWRISFFNFNNIIIQIWNDSTQDSDVQWPLN